MIIIISLLLKNESNEDEKRIPIILPNPRKVSVQLKLRKKNPLYMKSRQNSSLSHSNLDLNFSFIDGLNFTIFLQWTSHIDIPLVCFYPSHPFFLFFGFFWWHIQMDTFIHKSRTYPISYLYKRSTISRLCHFIIPYLSKTVNPSTIVHESYHCSLSLSHSFPLEYYLPVATTRLGYQNQLLHVHIVLLGSTIEPTDTTEKRILTALLSLLVRPNPIWIKKSTQIPSRI